MMVVTGRVESLRGAMYTPQTNTVPVRLLIRSHEVQSDAGTIKVVGLTMVVASARIRCEITHPRP